MIATPISTGIAGLDTVLGGGYTPRRLYLVEGLPGSGKTTLSMQFLMAGRDRGERVLYVSLSETEAELREMAASHGWSLDGIELYEPLASDETTAEPAGGRLDCPCLRVCVERTCGADVVVTGTVVYEGDDRD